MDRRTFLAGAAQAGIGLAAVTAAGGAAAPARSAARPPSVISLDGEWLLATDPGNRGREEGWFRAARPEAKRTKVPWIIQDAFPGCHGVAWYWREFAVPANPHPGGRLLLRFWAVDYLAEVWLNGQPVGGHEGGEGPFVLDATAAVRAGEPNLLAVRVLNPSNERIDGMVLAETPHRNKALPYTAGSAWDQGGIIDSVELLATPAVRVEDLFVRADPATGVLAIEANLRNAGKRRVRARLDLVAAPAASGETVAGAALERDLPPGDTLVAERLTIAMPRLWQLNDPFLYRVTARVSTGAGASFHESSVRCGLRDFRFEKGAFRLNGKRVYLRCSHTGNCCPVGLELPLDPDWLRRDLVNVKAMGFNAIRFIAGVPKRYQLDLCDEIGLLVYEENYASWCLGESPQMEERFDRSTAEMVRRDRNHPSVVLWGLLNETNDGPLFRHAFASLPLVRALDGSRVVMLNSGRFDGQTGSRTAGLQWWGTPEGPDPNVTRNPTDHALTGTGMTWGPGTLAFHPGPRGEYSVIRWTAPAAGEVTVTARFEGIAERATTDVHVLHGARELYGAGINVDGQGNAAQYAGAVTVRQGDTLDFVAGWGNGSHGGDSTGVAASIQAADGKTWDAAAGFSVESNPAGAWTYGRLPPGAKPDPATFRPYTASRTETGAGIGSLSNPGSSEWQDVLADVHPYRRVPHTAAIVRELRTMSGGANPVFVSEYGIGSAVDLWRAVRHYEQVGKPEVEDARFYADKLDRFLADWERWRMGEVFGTPADFFRASQARMAGQRLLGLNAIRANPVCAGHSMTGTVDQGMSGEGTFTTFRELKPGAVDAIFEGWAPLRLCLFVEPVNAWRKTPLRLEAVLADEDVLAPGEYPLRLQVFGPAGGPIVERETTVTIARAPRSERPFASPVFTEEVAVDGPPGRYRFVAAFERGAAAAGGEAEFFLDDRASMPRVTERVVLWGRDRDLAAWLAARGIPAASVDVTGIRPAVILVGDVGPEGEQGWTGLVRCVEQGSTAVFLSPGVFREGDDPTARLPLPRRGTLKALPSWLYHKDEWAKRHPVFDGLPAGGLLDYTFYRELVPDLVFSGLDAPGEAIAGANDASIDYSSGLMLAVYRVGAGRIIVNTLLVRENLETHPAAERLLRNLLRHAAAKAGGQ